MFMKRAKLMVAGVMLLAAAAATTAAAGTPEEAKALAEKAAALVAAEGEKAFPVISDPKGEFFKGDLYVTVLDSKGVVRANPNPKLIGMNMWEAEDQDGVKFTQEAWKAVESAEAGWQKQYKFTNPATKKIEPKKAWVHRVGDYVVLCGDYRNS